jgi:hypothetical protein
MDMFGPLKIMPSGKNFILCITDACSKYSEIVAIPDISALTVASALFLRWLYRHGLRWNLSQTTVKNSAMKL